MSTPKVYYLAVEPVDPTADILTIQETAYVLHVSVTTLRRVFKPDENCRLHSRRGRKIVTSREHRDRLEKLLHSDAKAKAKARARRRSKTSAARRPHKTAMSTASVRPAA